MHAKKISPIVGTESGRDAEMGEIRKVESVAVKKAAKQRSILD